MKFLNILQFIPQRHPFVMIDELLFTDENITCTGFAITAQNIFCEGGEFSEAGLLENMAQTAAAGRGYKEQMENKPVAAGYIAAVKNFEVLFLPKINDMLTTEIIVTDKIFNITFVGGKVLTGNALIARCEMKIFSNSND